MCRGEKNSGIVKKEKNVRMEGRRFERSIESGAVQLKLEDERMTK